MYLCKMLSLQESGGRIHGTSVLLLQPVGESKIISKYNFKKYLLKRECISNSLSLMNVLRI